MFSALTTKICHCVVCTGKIVGPFLLVAIPFIRELIFTLERKGWETVEIDAVTTYFHKFIIGKGLPGKRECEAFLKTNVTILKERTWRNIKDFIRNFKRGKTLNAKFD